MMRISQRLDYAVRALVAIANKRPGVVAGAGDIADELGLPRRFVEQQVSTLGAAGILECRRGRGGGCVLARPAESITLAEVVSVIEGTVLDTPSTPYSAVAEAWDRVGEHLDASMRTMTIADIAARQRELDVLASRLHAPEYVI